MQAVGKCLIIRYPFIVAHIEASVVAEYAGTDIVALIRHQFGYPLLVGKELTRKSRTVKPASGNRVRRRFGVKSARADDGNIYKFLYMLNICKVAVFRHIYRRMCPVPRVIGAVVAVEAIVARILKIFCRFFGFLHISAYLSIFLAGKRAGTETLCLGNDAVTQ